MTDPRNVAHDKRVKKQKKHHGDASESSFRPGMKPHQSHHQHPLPEGPGPDADEALDQTENPQPQEQH